MVPRTLSLVSASFDITASVLLSFAILEQRKEADPVVLFHWATAGRETALRQPAPTYRVRHVFWLHDPQLPRTECGSSSTSWLHHCSHTLLRLWQRESETGTYLRPGASTYNIVAFFLQVNNLFTNTNLNCRPPEYCTETHFSTISCATFRSREACSLDLIRTVAISGGDTL